MNPLNRISIKSRMILGFAIVVILFILFGLSSFYQLRELGRLTTILYDHPLQVSNASLRAMSGVIRMHRSMKDLVMSQTEVEARLAVQKVQSLERRVFQDLQVVDNRILGHEGKELVHETISMFTGWRPIRLEVQELVFKGLRESAGLITKTKGAAYVSQLEQKMTDLNTYARDKADGFMANAREVQDGLATRTIVFILIVAGTSFLVAMVIVRSIISNLGNLKGTMEKITTTGDLVLTDPVGRSEITEMAHHFNGLVHRLETQSWLRDGLNELNRELLGKETSEDLADRAIRFVARYSKACIGGLYAYDPGIRSLELIAGYAPIETGHLAPRFKWGEGLIGQVAADRNPVHLTALGPEEALVRTGTVSRPPDSVYALPLVHREELQGVLEVGYFEPLTEIRKEFLEAAAAIISTVLFSAAQNEKIKELYELSREANLELETRQRELDATNAELKAQTTELQTRTTELQSQATELQAQTIELEGQRFRVTEADRLKSEFLSNMSHELRTPLNSVLALSQLMISRGPGRDPAQEMEYLLVIERNGRHLLNLINDILDLSKIESGRMDLDLTEFNPDSVIGQALDTIRPLTEEKGLELIVENRGPKRILGDWEKLHQILLNLLTNAVKFTEQGRVGLTVEDRGAEIDFIVTDTGIGIAPEDTDNIFDQFRQVDGSAARHYDGTGLGLAICRKLANLLGGRIVVESTLEQGSTFTLSLPRKVANGNRIEIEQWPSAAPGPAPRDGRRTVLVIDDDPDVRDLIEAFLEENGYHPILAENGRAGLELALQHRPFAILLDILMPELDGFDVLRRLKDAEATRDIPVVIISVSEDQATASALGAAGYLPKPVDRRLLLGELEKLSRTHPISRIMVVDDDRTMRTLVQELLNETYYLVETASSGEEALRRIHTAPPDVVVLDLLMPEMDGFEVLDRLRSEPATRDLPVIILTSKDLDREEKEILREQTHRTIAKGRLDRETLLRDLDSALTKLEIGLTGTGPDRPLLLVVDDNATAALQIQTALEENGLGVIVAGSGAEALESIRRITPDGIILDLMMPEMDGFEVLNRVRSMAWTRDLPVLILTAKELTREERRNLTHNNVRELIQKGALNRAELVERVRALLNTGAGTRPTRPAEPGPVGSEVHHPTVLIVEDNPDNLLTIEAILEKAEYRLISAGDGPAALAAVAAEVPDLILMDIQLPGMSGLEVTRRLKADPDLAAIPVVALTAKAMKGDREQILAQGCDDYLAKPIDPEALLLAVGKWTE